MKSYYLIFMVAILLIIIYEYFKKLNKNMNTNSITPINKNLTIDQFDFTLFSDTLGQSESSNNYLANSNGIAYGKYQFTPQTIKQIAGELNISEPSLDSFLLDANMQDTFYHKYVEDILRYIDNNLTQYLTRPITGKGSGQLANINIYGLVAGAWLGGMGNLSMLLLSGQDKTDHSNPVTGGTFISDYVAKFSNLIT